MPYFCPNKTSLSSEGCVCVENSYCKQLRGCRLRMWVWKKHTLAFRQLLPIFWTDLRWAYTLTCLDLDHLHPDSVVHTRWQLSATGAAMSRIHIHIRYAVVIYAFLPCEICMAAVVINKVVKIRVYSNTCKHVTTLLPTKRVCSDEMGEKRGQIKGQKNGCSENAQVRQKSSWNLWI